MAAALTGLVNNAAGNFISRTKDLTPKGFNAISRTSFSAARSTRRWPAASAGSTAGDKASVISILTTWYLERRTVHRAVGDVEGGGQHHDQVAGHRMGSERQSASTPSAPGPFPTKGAWERLNPKAGARGDSSTGIPMGRNGEMVELANLAVFLMADGCEYLTGQTIAIDGAGHLGGSGNFLRADASR